MIYDPENLDFIKLRPTSTRIMHKKKAPLESWVDKQTNIPIPHRIYRGLQRTHQYNVGLPPKHNRILVVDVDKWKMLHNQDNDEEKRLLFLKSYPDFIKHFDTLTVRTPKGFHLYFQYEEGFPSTQSPYEVDIRSDTGYVVGIGSIVKGDTKLDGYTWEYTIVNDTTMKCLPDDLKSFQPRMYTVQLLQSHKTRKEDITIKTSNII